MLILGNTKKDCAPPDDFPNPAYGKALCEFREHSVVTDIMDIMRNLSALKSH